MEDIFMPYILIGVFFVALEVSLFASHNKILDLKLKEMCILLITTVLLYPVLLLYFLARPAVKIIQKHFEK